MTFPIQLPPPPGTSVPPVWVGNGFMVDQTILRVLAYDLGASGWTDELTALHEGVDDENHYMNLASRRHALNGLVRHLHVAAPVIIDIGCSSGFMVKDLRNCFPRAVVIGADYVRQPLEKLGSKMPDLPLLQFDLARCPLPANSFDAAVLLNVLEHIADDNLALRQIYRFLTPGGVAVIEVPAGPGLYDIYDQQLLHQRRYRMSDLLRQIRAVGLNIIDYSHLGFFFYPGFWLVKKRNRCLLKAPPDIRRAVVDGEMRRVGHNNFMHNIMRLELKLRQWIRYPIGIRCVVTCRK
jgi:ubiquinone/menaquinone biosynthesis C-methylase UbiE